MQLWMVLVAIILVFAFGFFVGGWLIQYNVEFWASRYSGREVDANFWLCSAAGVFVGWNIAIPVTIVTWVFDLAS